jgi:hypothetical protein
VVVVVLHIVALVVLEDQVAVALEVRVVQQTERQEQRTLVAVEVQVVATVFLAPLVVLELLLSGILILFP